MESEAARYELLLSGAEEALGALLTEKESSAHLIMETEARMRETEQGLEEVGERLEAVRAELNERSAGREELERSRRELMEKLSAIREDAASLAAEREATRLAAEQLETLRKGLAGDKEAREKAISEEEAGVSRLKEELAVKEERLAMLSGSVQNMKNRISELTSKRMGLEGERTKMEKSGQDKNRDLIELERRSAKLEQARLASDMEEKQILDRLWDTYELSRTAAQAVRLPLQSLSQANRRIAELKRGLGELGTPNLGAIEEFSRVSERYDFLTAQRDDVEKAKKDLLKVIADMTAEMKEIFTREFEAVNERFGKTFAELFGGGKASLELEDPENVLESGIEIKAQPPGKSLSVISLLSGGEKAYVAIALYFAIMKVRPTPFCVMDEIEAALDEANVARFAKYLRSMSHGTQFVVITHRRVTMEEADYIYGITMQEKGVSKVIELNVEEAEKASGE